MALKRLGLIVAACAAAVVIVSVGITPAHAKKKPWSWSKCIEQSQPFVTRPGTDVTWCEGKRAAARAKGRPIVR